MTARTDLDTYISGKVSILGGGPLDRPHAVDVFTALSNYIDYGIHDGTVDSASVVGAINAQTGLALTITKLSPASWQLAFTLTAVAMTWTDSGGSGSFGAIKLFDFIEGAWICQGSRRDLVYTFSSAITTGAGDLVFIDSLGSVTADAGDKALTSTEADLAAVSGDITCSGGVGTNATLLKGQGTGVDGTGTAKDIWLNVSGSAATSDANGTVAITGTITMIVAYLGDD